jgi:DNA-binding PadR family transcriptional regulator
MKRPDAQVMAGEPEKRPTELEHTVLGIIWRRGGCSAYDVRKEFATSLSAQWSDSSGSIYPLIARLQKVGLVLVEGGKGAARRRRQITITGKGMLLLKEWLRLPLERSGDPNPDPARTRMFFLDALPTQAEQIALVDELRSRTEASLLRVSQIVQAESQSKSNDWLAALGGEHQLRARLEWLATVRRHLLARASA